MSGHTDGLPRGWRLATLPELVADDGVLTDGDWVESVDQDPNGEVRLTQLADVGDGLFRDRSDRYMTRSKAAELRCTFLEKGDVLIARMPDPLGRACLFPGSKQPCVTVVDVCIVRPGSAPVHTPWLMHFINSPQFRAEVASLQAGSTRKRISKANLSTIALPVPPHGEQEAIAATVDAHFSRLDAATATLERVQRNLERYRASVLKAAVEGRLVPTEAKLAKKEGRSYEPASVLLKRILAERRRRWEEAELAKLKAKGKPPTDDKWKAKYEEPAAPDVSGLPELPEGWCWASVDAIGDVLLGRQRAPQYLTGLYPKPYLRVANIKDDHIDFSDVEQMDFDEPHFEKYRLQAGDILVSEGQSPELLGQSAIFRGRSDPLCFQKTLHRFRPLGGGPSSEFAQLVFRSHVRNGVFMRLGSITTNIAHLTLEKFKASPFPLAPQREQPRVEVASARQLSLIDSLDVEVSTQLSRIARLRQSILKWAFEGRLVGAGSADPAGRERSARDAGRVHPKPSPTP